MFAAIEEARLGVLQLLGRDPTLTDRMLLWADVLEIHRESVLGVGFEAFWLGWRRDLLWEKWWWGPLQAHNGYIEIYLNLGFVGLLLHVLLFFVVISRLLAAVRREGIAILQLTLLVVVLLHNITEASFVGIAFLWTIFYLVVFGSSPVLRHGRA